MPDDDAPQLYLLGGTEELWLDEEGRTFHPGDRMPRTLTNAKRASLQAAGIRFETRHPEPEPTPLDPERQPKDRAAAEAAEPVELAPGEVLHAPTNDDDEERASPPEKQPRRAASKE